jgi:hypothetical protein
MQFPRGSTKILGGTPTKSSVSGTILSRRAALMGLPGFMVDPPYQLGGNEPFAKLALLRAFDVAL